MRRATVVFTVCTLELSTISVWRKPDDSNIHEPFFFYPAAVDTYRHCGKKIRRTAEYIYERQVRDTRDRAVIHKYRGQRNGRCSHGVLGGLEKRAFLNAIRCFTFLLFHPPSSPLRPRISAPARVLSEGEGNQLFLSATKELREPREKRGSLVESARERAISARLGVEQGDTSRRSLAHLGFPVRFSFLSETDKTNGRPFHGLHRDRDSGSSAERRIALPLFNSERGWHRRRRLASRENARATRRG